MADWPVIGGGQFAKQLNPDGATSSVDEVVCVASDTKGSWAEIIASTNEAYGGFNLYIIRKASAALAKVMVDVGIGASGSEVVIFENLIFSCASPTVYSIFLPLSVPVGTRISVRGQSATGSDIAVWVSVVGVPMDYLYQSYQQATTYGAATATTSGVALPTTVEHTKGSYVEITSATTHEIKCLIIDVAWDDNATSANREFLFDIAVGASGSEQVIISDIHVWQFSVEIIFPPVIMLPVNIPAGSRIAARTQQTYGSATYTIELVLHGLS